MKVRHLMVLRHNSADRHRPRISIDLFGPQTTSTEIRIHGCEYNSNIKAAGCMVALDIVYL